MERYHLLWELTRAVDYVTFDLFTATVELVKKQMDKRLLDRGLLLEPIEMGKWNKNAQIKIQKQIKKIP